MQPCPQVVVFAFKRSDAAPRCFEGPLEICELTVSFRLALTAWLGLRRSEGGNNRGQVDFCKGARGGDTLAAAPTPNTIMRL